MKIIKQIFIILLFYILGEFLSYIINSLISVFIPGAILGMLLLLLALLTNVIKLEAVDDVGSFLTNNMAFFFIPAAVSVLEYFDILKSIFLLMLLIIVISLVVSFFVISYVVKIIIILQKRRDNHA